MEERILVPGKSSLKLLPFPGPMGALPYALTAVGLLPSPHLTHYMLLVCSLVFCLQNELQNSKNYVLILSGPPGPSWGSWYILGAWATLSECWKTATRCPALNPFLWATVGLNFIYAVSYLGSCSSRLNLPFLIGGLFSSRLMLFQTRIPLGS